MDARPRDWQTVYATPHYDVDEAFYKSFWFAVNNNILYFMVDYSDDTMELWNTDLSVPLLNQTVPTVLQTYSPSTVGNAGSIALSGVDNGHVVFAFSPPDSQKGTTVAEFDAATGQTNYYDLGPDTTVKSLAPVWFQLAEITVQHRGFEARARPVGTKPFALYRKASLSDQVTKDRGRPESLA